MTKHDLITGDGCKPVAKAINAAWQAGQDGLLESMFKVGRMLIIAKNGINPPEDLSGKCEHGTFKNMLKTKLNFDYATGNKLMVLAAHPILSKVECIPSLPSWAKSYKLTFAARDVLIKALADGGIHPAMTDHDVRVLRGLETAKSKEPKQMSEHHNKTNAALKASLKEANRQNKQSREINQQLTHDNGVIRVERDHLRKQDDDRRADPVKAVSEAWEIANDDQREQIRNIVLGRPTLTSIAGGRA